MRCIITLSMAMAILCAALGFSTLASAEVAPVNISGPWKIDSGNGPSPVCGFEQAGNNLTGSCIGLKAKGTITGTIIGEQVRWHWQWVTYAGNVAAAFDFIGTLRPDNTITGMIERRDIGLSVNFTALWFQIKPTGYWLDRRLPKTLPQVMLQVRLPGHRPRRLLQLRPVPRLRRPCEDNLLWGRRKTRLDNQSLRGWAPPPRWPHCRRPSRRCMIGMATT